MQVITFDERQEIANSAASEEKKAVKMLEVVAGKPHTCWEAFIGGLRQGCHGHIADVLEKKWKENLNGLFNC